MAYPFIITHAGRAAIVNAANTGTDAITLSQIGLGSTYAPATAARTTLGTEIKRLAASGGGAVAPDTIHVTAADSSADEYTVREIGIYTNAGDLFAIYSQVAPISIKAAGTVALFAADILITGLPAGAVTVGDTTFAYPQATETVKGVAELATEAETLGGADDERIVTPKKLWALIATTARRGLVRLATAAETQAGADGEKAVTPAALATVTATTLRRGLAELATFGEVQAGEDNERVVTPAGLSSRTATMARSGLIELATTAEAQAGTDDERALTPKKLQDVTATTARAGVIRTASNADVQAAADEQRALTPANMGAILTGVFAAMYPIGEILITRRAGNPSGWLGFGTWERYGAGRVLAGHDPLDADFDLLDKTGGAKAITLTVGQMPGHTHAVNPPATDTTSNGEHTHHVAITGNGNPGAPGLTAANSLRTAASGGGSEERYNFAGIDAGTFVGKTSNSGAHGHTVDIGEFASGSAGGGEAHTNLQPYVVVFMWKRVA